jgi:acetyltransferase-like isoleucine patch superfamily enzyme
VYISDHSHGDYGLNFHSSPRSKPSDRKLFSSGSVQIKENSWIGEGVKILPNVTIGKGVIIGANAVVSKNIPDYTIAVGIPAKVIKKYNFTNKKWEMVISKIK